MQVVLVLGDASGKVSAWALAKSAAAGDLQGAAQSLSVTEAHGAGIVALKVISTAIVGVKLASKSSSKYTIISSSRNGEVRAWMIGRDGSLSLLAFSSRPCEAMSMSMSAAIFRCDDAIPTTKSLEGEKLPYLIYSRRSIVFICLMVLFVYFMFGRRKLNNIPAGG
jgi:hypothetical protein